MNFPAVWTTPDAFHMFNQEPFFCIIPLVGFICSAHSSEAYRSAKEIAVVVHRLGGMNGMN